MFLMIPRGKVSKDINPLIEKKRKHSLIIMFSLLGFMTT